MIWRNRGERFIPFGCKTWKQNPFGMKTLSPSAASVQCSIYLGGYHLESPFPQRLYKSGKRFGQGTVFNIYMFTIIWNVIPVYQSLGWWEIWKGISQGSKHSIEEISCSFSMKSKHSCGCFWFLQKQRFSKEWGNPFLSPASPSNRICSLEQKVWEHFLQ